MRILRRFIRNWSATIAVIYLIVLTVVAIVGPWVYGNDPWEMIGVPLLWPGDDSSFPLGTDLLGRDVLAQMLYGARISLLIGLIATTVALVIGVIVGALSGYYGGKVDFVLTRFTEIVQTIPTFLLCIIVLLVLGTKLLNVMIAIGIASWPPVARIVRGEVFSYKNRDFIQAARGLGMSNARILLSEILPGVLAPVIAYGALMVAAAILVEAGLSFLGLSDPNVMTWGVLIGIGREVLTDAWYIAAIPGAAITITLLAINIAGEGLNDALNARIDLG